MNDFLYQELLNEEYLHERMAESATHNQSTHLSENKITLFTYWSLSKLGMALENLGCKMRVRYENLALSKRRAALPNFSK